MDQHRVSKWAMVIGVFCGVLGLAMGAIGIVALLAA